MNDVYYMRKAIALAERGRATVSPNPMVGALVVNDEGVIVGRGSHRVAGGPHAEIIALGDAGARASGATLYCTLEPCCHVGRTGPCAPAVAAAGIRRVVIAMEDPNPLVNGGGIVFLRDKGIDVSTGILREEAARQNEVFVTSVRRRRPFIIVKAAISVDGCLTAAPGTRVQLTGPHASRFVHRQRAEIDAIGVGAGTIIADDPLLTPRGAYRSRPLTRVIFDRRLSMPSTARVFSTAEAGPVIIASTESAASSLPAHTRTLEAAGATLLLFPTSDFAAQAAALRELGITSLLLEGGARLHREALDSGLVDLVQVYVAPRVLGPSCVKWMPEGSFSLGDLHSRRVRWLGEDALIEGYVHGPD
jgi:diaminohydroxyphosphoribosylaminopyrimidine deaminase/5-amino-6-(5-phosphoribosylamino)uracil reductase